MDTRSPKPANLHHGIFIAGALILLAVALCYASSFGGAFIFDDETHVAGNPDFRSLLPPWRAMFNVRSYVHPVGGLSFAISHALSGLDSWSYHLMNLLIHMAAALFLFGAVRRTFLRLRSGSAAHLSTYFAAAVALLWAVHPLQTQSVTYIYQRYESQMGMFFLMSLYFFIRGVEKPVSRPGWLVASVFACLLSAGTKQVAYAIPLLTLLYDRTFVAGSFLQALRARWLYYAALGLSWLLLILLQSTAPMVEEIGFDIGIGPFRYALSQLGVVAHYLRLAVWPEPLCFDYGWPVAKSFRDAAAGAVVLLPLLVATAWALFKRPGLGFLGAWFFLILAPTSTFLPIRDLAAENRMYLPLVAVVVLFVLALGRVLSLKKAPALSIIGVLVLVSGALTVKRNVDYHDPLGMWKDVIAKRPAHFRGWGNAAYYCYLRGDYKNALGHLNKSLELKNDNPAYNLLGSIYVRLGKHEEARAAYEAALRIKPEFADVHNNIGNVLVKLGRFREADYHLRRAIRYKPGLEEARYNLRMLEDKLRAAGKGGR